jgi:hypothetical protein
LLTDLSGRDISDCIAESGLPGKVNIELKVPENIAPGVFNLIVMRNNRILVNKRVVKINK